MTRNECIRALQEAYRDRRAQNEAKARQRFAEVSLKDPMISQLREENSHLAISTMKRIAVMSDIDQKKKIAEDMRKAGLENNAEIGRRLEALGYPRDYLSMQYDCPHCKDTGLTDEIPARFCECFEKALRIKLYEDGSMMGINEETFEKFDLNCFPEADGQRAYMEQIKNSCEEYANAFPNTRFRNILLTGAGGLGKTYLLNCIFARVTERNGEAIRVTAYRLFEAMRHKYFNDTAEGDDFDTLVNAPMLLIDDLGSEPMMRNITTESLFILLNERLQAGRHTVVTTNLSPLQIQEHYGERVMSRLVNRQNCAVMLLKGKDLRKR